MNICKLVTYHLMYKYYNDSLLWLITIDDKCNKIQSTIS